MRTHYKALIFLFFALVSVNQAANAQTAYSFQLRGPVVDSANGMQYAYGQGFWLEAAPGFPGMIGYGYNLLVDQNGYYEDSVYVFGPGTGTLLLSTIDCRGDTVTTSVAFDSSFTTHVADTIFLCAASNAICNASFVVNNTPGNPTLSFQGNPTGAGVLTSETWGYGNGIYSSVPSYTYVNNGTYYVTYEVTYSTGCHSSAGQYVTVTGANVVCSTSILASQWGATANLYVNSTASGTPVHFDWNFGDGQTLSTGTNGIIHSYSVSGNYNVCVVTTFSDGCQDTTCQLLTVTVGSQGSCTAWFSHGVTGQTVQFVDSTTSTAQVQTWWWDFGDGATDSTSGATVSHTYVGQGPFVARLEIFTADTCYDVATDTVHLLPPSNCSAGFTHAPDTSGQYTILAYNTSVGTNLSYLWDFGDGSTSTQAYPTHPYAGAGTYQICLAVTQSNPACTDTFCDSVTVTQKQAMAFTFAVWNPATAVEEVVELEAGLLIAPQPVRDRMQIRRSIEADGEAQVGIYNAQGQIVQAGTTTFVGSASEWDVTALSNGIYFLRIGKETTRFWVLR
ncbi:MAG: PKD domain-containing protein [Bacteroidetes bacterium]|nr:PKD domain-containing protein [Bacteroidota bacterium]